MYKTKMKGGNTMKDKKDLTCGQCIHCEPNNPHYDDGVYCLDAQTDPICKDTSACTEFVPVKGNYEPVRETPHMKKAHKMYILEGLAKQYFETVKNLGSHEEHKHYNAQVTIIELAKEMAEIVVTQETED